MMKTRINGRFCPTTKLFRALIILLLSAILLIGCRDRASRPTSSPATPSPLNQPTSSPKATLVETDPALALHQRALVFDAHADTIQRVLAGGRLNEHHSDWQIDLPHMRAGGLDAQFLAVFVDSIYRGESAVKRTRQTISAIEQLCAENPRDLAIAHSAAEVEAIVARGQIALLIGIEGGHAINNDLTKLAEFYQRGVRYLGLTWSNTNDWADAAGDVALHHGLTEFGRQVVREMNRLGMLVDISHASDQTFADVLATSTKPVIASHSACRALCHHPRNLSDEMLRALAKQGGVCCINFYSEFVDEAYRQRNGNYHKVAGPNANQFSGDLDRLAIARFNWFLRSNGNPPPKLDALIDQIDHAVKVAGIDHVGLGSDFDGADSFPIGISDASQLPNITRALLARGYSASDIEKLLGGNLLRVLREVNGQ